MKPQCYKIGTRASLLAWTQSTIVKEQLETLSGHQFQLVPVTTQGDLQTETPLWQLEGANFFTKELDHALLNKEVDLVIHSYKDLGSSRPAGISLAAVTQRQFAHDVLLIKKTTIEKLKKNELSTFSVGSSSPRRIYNINQSLAAYLPFGAQLKINPQSLRGNLTSRLEKLHTGQYHAIVIALAGIERLAQHHTSVAKLRPLLASLNYMVLPRSDFPPAAAQGALAIECLTDNFSLLNILSQVNHPETAQEVMRERQAFNNYGGGCHLAVGISTIKKEKYYLHIHKGQHEHPIHLFQLEGADYPTVTSRRAFIGIAGADDPNFLYDQLCIQQPLEVSPRPLEDSNFYLTSKHCLGVLDQYYTQGMIWCAGAKTMRTLAAKGHWVNGSSDSLGESECQHLLGSNALKLMGQGDNSIKVLTHLQGSSHLGEIIPCYQRQTASISQEYLEKLKLLDLFYWTSFEQYQKFQELIPQTLAAAHHCCGLGKSFTQFKNTGIKIHPFFSIASFKNWILYA